MCQSMNLHIHYEGFLFKQTLKSCVETFKIGKVSSLRTLTNFGVLEILVPSGWFLQDVGLPDLLQTQSDSLPLSTFLFINISIGAGLGNKDWNVSPTTLSLSSANKKMSAINF